METFADDFGALTVFLFTEEFFTALLFVTSADLREVFVSLAALELPTTLAGAFFSTLRETSLAFPTEFLSIFLLPATVDDLRGFSVTRFTEEFVVLLVTLVAEDLSTPERAFSIDLL